MRVSQRDSRVVAGALDVIRGSWKVPKIQGLDEWRGILGWQHHAGGDYGAPHAEPQYRDLRKQGRRLWELLLQAAATACVVVGDPSPLAFRNDSDQSDSSVAELAVGGLLDRDGKGRSVSYWLAFGSDRANKSSVTAMVCSRTRVLGAAEIEMSQLPKMTVRLDLDNAIRKYNGILIPVPAATLSTYKGPLTFPLNLVFRRP